VHVCVFDLDHTLIHSPLDLAAMARDMQTVLERRHRPLPPRDERYRIGELIGYCRRQAPPLEATLWAIALDHERRALAEATPEPGARDAVAGACAAGWRTALWTNNAREITLAVLERFALLDGFDVVVTRDDMAALKPDPDGWRVIRDHFTAPLPARSGAPRGHSAHAANPGGCRAVVVGDSWVDGLAAAAAGVPFVAYRPNPADLARWQIKPVASLVDLAALPAWLRTYRASGAG
jgi:phosphoglycolate phosphatase